MLHRTTALTLTAVAFFGGVGCATMQVGHRYENPNSDPRQLRLCAFTSDRSVPALNMTQMVMRDSVGRSSTGKPSSAIRGGFISASFVTDLSTARDCDVAVSVPRALLTSTMRPITAYSVYTRKEVLAFQGNVEYGPNGAARVLSERFAPGTALYEQVLRDAGPQRRAQMGLVEAPSPAESSSVSRDELKSLVAEAVKAAAQPAVAERATRSDVDVPRYKRPQDPDAYAVVVGVERYTDLPAAEFAERDAQAVYDHLVALGYPPRNIALLRGAQATKTGIIKNLEAWLPQNVGERSTVFFYYSGHGAPDPRSSQAYLVPSDGDPQYLEETAYPVKRVYEKLAALKARRVLVALDSCFSGAGGRSVLARGTRPLVGKVSTGFAGGKVVALSASESDQISGAAPEQGHGLFTYHLLKGLNGEAADGAGRVTVRSLFAYISPRVQDDAKRANRVQAPQLQPAALSEADDFRLR